jgi:hypothetical protein
MAQILREAMFLSQSPLALAGRISDSLHSQKEDPLLAPSLARLAGMIRRSSLLNAEPISYELLQLARRDPSTAEIVNETVRLDTEIGGSANRYPNELDMLYAILRNEIFPPSSKFIPDILPKPRKRDPYFKLVIAMFAAFTISTLSTGISLNKTLEAQEEITKYNQTLPTYVSLNEREEKLQRSLDKVIETINSLNESPSLDRQNSDEVNKLLRQEGSLGEDILNLEKMKRVVERDQEDDQFVSKRRENIAFWNTIGKISMDVMVTTIAIGSVLSIFLPTRPSKKREKKPTKRDVDS